MAAVVGRKQGRNIEGQITKRSCVRRYAPPQSADVRFDKMKWQRPVTYTLLAVAALATTVLAFNTQMWRDWGFICENTGSRKGYRQWTLGPKTGHWYKKSPLEEFITKEFPHSLAHRWTSYAGTGKNVFGTPVLFGHGRPGAILRFDLEIQSRWIAHNPPEEVKKLYNLLVSDDQDHIGKRIMDIWEEVLEYED